MSTGELCDRPGCVGDHPSLPARAPGRDAATQAAAADVLSSDTSTTDDLFDLADALTRRGEPLTGSLARRGKSETDTQKRLSGHLQDFFASRDAWKQTLSIKAKLAGHRGLRGRANQMFAAAHLLRLAGQGTMPTGMMLPRKKWEDLGRDVTGDGFEIFVPRNWSREEEDPETGETETVTGRGFVFGGANRRYYDACETEGPPVTAGQYRAAMYDAAKEQVHGETEAGESAFHEAMTERVSEMGFKLVYKSRDEMPMGAHGYFSDRDKTIAIDKDATPAEQASTIAHELAHANDTYLADDHDGEKYAAQRDVCEFIAESVAFAVSEHYGVDTAAATAVYLDSWRPERLKQAKNVYNRAERAMDAILGVQRASDAETG